MPEILSSLEENLKSGKNMQNNLNQIKKKKIKAILKIILNFPVWRPIN